MKKLFLFLVLSISYSQIIGQTNECDTIYLTDGKKIVANIQNVYVSNISYVLCCSECTEIRKVPKAHVQSIHYSSGNVKTFDHSIPPQSPVVLGIEAGGAGIIGGAYLELSPMDKFGFRFGTGYFFGTLPIHSSIFLRLGTKGQFVPSIGITKFYDIGSGIIDKLSIISNYYGLQKNLKSGYIRLSPGLIIIMPDKEFQPWIGVSIGFNLIK